MKAPHALTLLHRASLACLAVGCTPHAVTPPPRTEPAATRAAVATADPLPSWRDGEIKQSIRLKEFVAKHGEWSEEQPFKAALAHDWSMVAASGEAGRSQLLAAVYGAMTTAEFDANVTEWIGSKKHPRFDRRYTELVFQPMLELLAYLRANEFKVFIVSGGGVDFLRPWTERVYGIPPERVIGSRVKLEYASDDTPALRRLPAVDLIDDRSGKPVGVQQAIGRRPIFAFGNSDGDFEMLEWTTSGPGPRFGALLHHTDPEREWAYDRTSHVGKLSHALDEAPARGWLVVDMKRDWRTVVAFAN